MTLPRHSTRTMRLLAAIVVAAVAMTACRKAADSADSRPTIAVSIEPQRFLLEKIAGTDFNIVTILDNGANPETFDPSVAKRVAADKAVAYFGIGNLPFETVVASSLSHPDRYADTSEGIVPLTGTHGHDHEHEHDHGDTHGHHHGDIDPHVWTSVSGARVIAANMARRLSSLNPARADIYARRLDSLDHSLDSLDRALRSRLDSAPSRSFAVWHPSLSYFARDYGLEQIAVGTESKEVSLTRLRRVADTAAAHGVKVLFFQKEFDSRQAEAINSRIGSRLVTINPLDYNWTDQLNLIADEIARH